MAIDLWCTVKAQCHSFLSGSPSCKSHSCLQVGVIRLSGFNARAQQDVAQAVKALTRQGASEFTLDVRDNRGGLYQEGAEVAKLFLQGKLLYRLSCLLVEDLHGSHYVKQLKELKLCSTLQ